MDEGSLVALVRYYKHLEDPNVAMHIRFYDREGNELKNVIELDPDQHDGNPNGKRISLITGEIEDCFYEPCMVEVDGVVNPPAEELQAFRTLHKAKHFSLLPHEERMIMMRGIIDIDTKKKTRTLTTTPTE